MIAELIGYIKQRLEAELAGDAAEIKVDDFPAEPEEFRRFSRSAVLPRFTGKTVNDTNRCIYTIEVAVVSLKLSDGVYNLLDSVDRALNDWKIPKPGVSRMSLQSVRYVAREQGVWMYALTYAVYVAKQANF